MIISWLCDVLGEFLTMMMGNFGQHFVNCSFLVNNWIYRSQSVRDVDPSYGVRHVLRSHHDICCEIKGDPLILLHFFPPVDGVVEVVGLYCAF